MPHISNKQLKSVRAISYRKQDSVLYLYTEVERKRNRTIRYSDISPQALALIIKMLSLVTDSQTTVVERKGWFIYVFTGKTDQESIDRWVDTVTATLDRTIVGEESND